MAKYAEKEAPLLERIIMQEGLERSKAEDWARNEITRLREEKSILQQQLSNTNHCLEKTQKENVRLKNTRGCGRC